MSDVSERTEWLVPGPAEALSGLLGVPLPGAAEGLPLLWHWVYLLDRPAQADLGPDGHPERNIVAVPPGDGRRRMWAGGQVRTRGRLMLGEEATRRTAVLSVREKVGRSGPLTFVTLGHRVHQRGRVVVDERQDIVYRAPAAGGETPPEPAGGPAAAPTGGWQIDTSSTLLFRFSALTYNAHRIHYDRDYARDVEGYPGLLVHGPLQAIAMAELARARGRTGDVEFEYRLSAPLFDHQGMVVDIAEHGAEATAVVRDRTGRQTATATVRPG
jgi:3-methylfumaryl-CoA hydratase